MKKIAAASALLLALPGIALAQGTFAPIQLYIVSIGNIIALLIPILIGVAMIFFFWGLVQYIRAPDIKKGKDVMLAGILGLFIMVSLWGIIKLVQSAIIGNQNPTQSIPAPHFPTN